MTGSSSSISSASSAKDEQTTPLIRHHSAVQQYSSNGASADKTPPQDPHPNVGDLIQAETHVDPKDFLQITNGVVSGKAATVGERHLSYLIRARETNDVTPETGKIKPNKTRYCCKFPTWIHGPAQLIIFLISYYVSVLHMSPMSATTVSLFIAYLIMWVVVLITTGCHLYRGYSIIDGMNVITRFTVKMTIKGGTFVDCNMPSSVSSTVSTRGSTLNKLMFGVSLSLGLGLFLKFISMRELVTDVIAHGYVSIIATSMYENRTFGLEDGDSPITHHRMKRRQLMSREEGPLKEPDLKTSESAIYTWMHAVGVLFFIGVTFIGMTINRHEHYLSFILSLIGLLLGIVFVIFNDCLNSVSPNLFNSSKATIGDNILKGSLCMAIEIFALSAAALAGVLYEQ